MYRMEKTQQQQHNNNNTTTTTNDVKLPKILQSNTQIDFFVAPVVLNDV